MDRTLHLKIAEHADIENRLLDLGKGEGEWRE